MPVDEALNTRMRDALAAHAGISEKRMMGGHCFFLNGHMLCGARRHKDGVGRFMFRVGKAQETMALSDPTAQAVIHGARRLGGFIQVEERDCDGAAMHKWLALCLTHAAALPAKN
ncbi:MAG: TfoX/Sxy family protein [Pseudomonadota bacterium]